MEPVHPEGLERLHYKNAQGLAEDAEIIDQESRRDEGRFEHPICECMA